MSHYSALALAIGNKSTAAQGDYLGENGLLFCGKCHTRKQIDIDWPQSETGVQRVFTPCDCRKKALAQAEHAAAQRAFDQRMTALRRDGLSDKAYLKSTFDRDDGAQISLSKLCRSYVDKWEEMEEHGMGILFYGSVGTGKSFFACCIANALLARLVPVLVTSFPKVLSSLQGFGEEKQALHSRLQACALLVIDDLGVERSTTYAAEQVFNIIDARARSGKPTIITTNLTLAEIEDCPDLQYKRIYDRILQMCPIQLKMTGKSRRIDESAVKRDLAREIVKGARV